MPAVVTAGARAFLDSDLTDDEDLGVCVGLFAELDDGRRISADPQLYTAGPRRGIGALWGHISVDPLTLPSLDPELFARDPLEATTQALEASFALGPEHLEEFIRSEIFDEDATEFATGDADELQGWGFDSSDFPLWINLITALREAGVSTTVTILRSVPFRVEFEASLLAEFER